MIKQCPYCDEYFSDKMLEMHISVCEKKGEAESEAFICPDCGEHFTEKSAFTAHMDLHKDKTPVN